MSRPSRHVAGARRRRGRPRERLPLTRRAVILALLSVLLAAVLAALRLGVAGRRTVSAPNVLLITIDTLRWDHVGCYGGRDGTTPVLDRLAARGARFETAIAHAPLTAPSHASILTGLTPLRHGVRDNGAFVLPPELPTLATALRGAGYATAAFISGFPLDRRFGFANGFDTYDDRLPRGDGTDRAGETERRADLTTDHAIDWLMAYKSKGVGTKWFMWVHYFDPHAAYDPPGEFLARFPARPYDGEVAFVDSQIGRLFQSLEEQGRLSDTVVLVVADHGESLGQHGEETHGVFVYDATVRVPWIMAGPGIRQGAVPEVVARGVDAMPTLLDLAGVATPGGLEGRSLRPAIEGGSMPDEPAYLEALVAARHFGWAPLHGLRDAHWKYIEAPRRELYDLTADPEESVNRLGEFSARAVPMARRLDSLRRAPSQAAERPRDRETGDRLRALGYISAAAGGRGDIARDPKDGIAVISRVERAIAALRASPRESRDALRAVLAEDPAIDIARRELALALSRLADHRGAVEQLEMLRSKRVATAEDLVLLSESLRVIGRSEESSRALDQAAHLDPRSPEVPLTSARALLADHQPDEAAAAYRRALALAPDHPEALTGLGDAALARGNLGEAAEFLERVLRRDPRDVAARTRLGIVRGRQGRMGEAIALLEEVVRERPAQADALAGLAAALARTGSPGAAIPYFERAISAGLHTPAVLTGLGFAKLETGDRAGALTALRASLALYPDQPGVQKAVRDLSGGTVPDSRIP